jgi:hypothetical protein
MANSHVELLDLRVPDDILQNEDRIKEVEDDKPGIPRPRD